MKNIYLSVLFLIPIWILSQNNSKLDHQKRVHIKNDNTYIQKSLPIYLNFSTEPNGKNYTLNSKVSKDYTNPMYLDTEGINYIRSKWAVDKNTKKAASPQQEILFEIYADGLAPKTISAFKNAPKYISNKNYYGKGLVVDLNAKDYGSGLENIHFRLNSDGFKVYSSSLEMNKEGEINLYYYSSDNVGNSERIKNKGFVVDLTPPTTAHSIKGIVYQESILSPKTSFIISSNDNLSGVKNTFYLFDETDKSYYSSNIKLYNLKDGDHVLKYWSTDNVKNSEMDNAKTFSFYLDKISPVSKMDIVGDFFKGKYNYVSERTEFKITSTDNKAGVKNIYYRINGKERSTYSQNFKLPNKQGIYTIKYNAVDNVENISKNSYKTLFLDNNPPETWIKYGSPQFFKDGELFITSKTKVILNSKDGESGVQNTLYSIDTQAMKNYSSFTVDGEGKHSINFYSTDNVNNTHEKRESKCHVDNTPPEIFHNFSIEPSGTKKDGGETLNVYPNYTRLYLGATDQKVGTDKILYSIGKGKLVPYSSGSSLDISELNTFLKNKLYEVNVQAIDKLGNKSEKTIRFFVGKSN